MVVTTLRVLRDRGWNVAAISALVVGGLLVIGLVWSAADSARVKRLEAERAAEEAEAANRRPTFPIPPMDLVVPPSPRLISAGVTPSALGSGAAGQNRISDDRGQIDG